MITRKTLKLFGCHEAAVEQFAREAGLPVEQNEPKTDYVVGMRVKRLSDGEYGIVHEVRIHSVNVFTKYWTALPGNENWSKANVEPSLSAYAPRKS